VGIEPIKLQAKEGLSLINGTQAMTALGILAHARADSAARYANVVGAWSLEALLGTSRAFDARIQELRPHPGQGRSASLLRSLLTEDSEIMKSHADCNKVQDPYSLRCMPQVHGSVWDALDHVGAVLRREINSVTDNPLVFPEQKEFLSGGNFHGAPVAFAMDYMAIIMTALMSISERRIEQLVNPHLSSGLPPFLAEDTGLNSGFMIAQVSAASLVSEGKVLAHPASVDSIPSSANREDHVSMGMTAALKAEQIVGYVEHVLGIETMCAAQGLDLRAPLTPGKSIQRLQADFRKTVPYVHGDVILYPLIQESARWVRDRRWVACLP
jgi:histidine ammonia-lyase